MADWGHKARTCLWFASGGLEAAQSYVDLIPSSTLESVFGPEDAPVMVNFTLAGTPYQILNGGDHHQLTPACSISILTEDQAETDRLWDALLGTPMACGWLTDRFGLSWQIVPRRLTELMMHEDPAVVARVNDAMQQMIKFDIAALEAAARG